ncbi:MAG: hypothetical protein ACTJH6_07310 [Microbacterium gubbeenense]|uniref:hypothetical protein n=1 Tax=Microbacterium gubbeenense TaxID=159896 RepID=UPI003F9CC985
MGVRATQQASGNDDDRGHERHEPREREGAQRVNADRPRNEHDDRCGERRECGGQERRSVPARFLDAGCGGVNDTVLGRAIRAIAVRRLEGIDSQSGGDDPLPPPCFFLALDAPRQRLGTHPGEGSEQRAGDRSGDG